jgi:hypothetical protein
MDGREFLDVARELVQGAGAAHWRAAAGRAYYALMLEAREALRRWGFIPQRREDVHAFVRLRFVYAADGDLKDVGLTLDRAGRLRNRADYDLTSTYFATDSHVQEAIRHVARGLASLDAVEADPTRRAAAIADIRARWP